jgi:nicotinamidase-related amidase
MQAIIIVDMQEGPLKCSNKFDLDGVTNRINTLLELLRSSNHRNPGKAQNLVIFIQHDGRANEGLLPHSSGWQILKTLHKTAQDIVIRKTTNDAFFETNLETTLKKHAITELIFCGWATDFCVDSSIKAAVSKNYSVIVVGDCHTLSDRDVITEQHEIHNEINTLPAPALIKYHNWLWQNLITKQHPVRVLNAENIQIKHPQSRTSQPVFT